jgi:hypothetical protein
MLRLDEHSRPSLLVAAMLSRLPAILAEVHYVLAEQHPDYAGFLTENDNRSGASRV